MPTRSYGQRLLLAGCLVFLIGSASLGADGQPQWGERHSRNMISKETGLPDGFDPATGENIKWSAALGTEGWATPVVGSGKVLIGTNNGEPRDPRHNGDRGVTMCFNQSDGSFAWQLVVPKLSEDRFFDWPRVGMCSPPTIEGDRVYTVTNRDEVVCLDINGLADGNDGPYTDEGRHMALKGEPPMEPGPLDADILWLLDLRTAAGVRPHDSAHCSILLDGPYLYINTSNGLTSRHDGVDKPEAPSLVVVEKTTGRLVAQERDGLSQKIFHCTWSSPSLGEVDGRRSVFYCGGDGVCYRFDALDPADRSGQSTDRVESLHHVWRFDGDPTAPKENVHSYIRNRRESPSNIKSMPVFVDDRLYVTLGGDIWWGKNKAWLQCIDATGQGDVTKDGLLWSYPLEPHCCSTPSVHDGLVYVADYGGKLHCVDAVTGRPYWVHDIGEQIYASTLVADSKVYIGTRRGDFQVLAAGKEKRLLSSIKLDAPVVSTAVAADGMLYVASMTRLFALKKGARGEVIP